MVSRLPCFPCLTNPPKEPSESPDAVLTPEYHPLIFSTLAGDKLKFKNLSKKIWDENRNHKYEIVSLLPSLEEEAKTKSVVVKDSQPNTHGGNYNKIKNMYWMFFDDEIGKHGISDFFNNNRSNINSLDFETALKHAVKNYKNPKNISFKRKERYIFFSG